jgi:hypothetical protein
MSDVVDQRHELPFIGHMICGIAAVKAVPLCVLFVELLALFPVKRG